jgi:hypothetical protein
MSAEDSDGSPKCERMKSRNVSFEDDGEEYAAEVSSEKKAASSSNPGGNEAKEGEEDDCLHFFDATQYLHNQDAQKPGARRTLHTSPQHDAEEELQEAVAYSGALVGENVLDAPSSSRVRNNASLARGPPPQHSSLEASDPGLSAGLVAQGFAYLRSQREMRRRKYLQYQAEQQLRKIKEAQIAERLAKEPPSSKGLFANSIFQNITYLGKSDETGNGDSTKNLSRQSSHSDKEIHDFVNAEEEETAQATVSQSGYGYSVNLDVSFDEEEEEDASWIPTVRVEEEDLSEEGASLCLLSQDQRQQVAQHVLPTGIAYAKWKRVYSLARDGDSFESCLRLVKDYNQTLMIIRTSRNEVFGAFADEAWEQPNLAGVQYHGGPCACLFSIPDVTKAKVKAYRWTGANRYIQLTDIHRMQLAFGGGGEEGSFGLCVESDFRLGSTGPCETFGNDPLCTQENFQIVDLEMFGFLLGQF